jgi:MFS superfamily sulfate permease-like transporter
MRLPSIIFRPSQLFQVRIAGNDFNRSELAGAFGDLGTLIPFAVGYITINGLNPQGVLLGFGLLAVATGLYFRTPMSVQPMKATATAAITQPELITSGAIFVAALATGLLWLVMGATRAVSWLAALTARPVVLGIVLGLGLGFIAEGVKLMQSGPTVAIGGAVLTFLLFGQRRLPAMLALLGYGAAAALAVDPTLARDLGSLTPSVRLPRLTVPNLTWQDVLNGTLVLALPQAALTLGNAIIATAEEHNALFPERPITVRLLAFDHAIMNLLAAPLGGVPMCRGAGGMAGHIRFGAHTGGALVILGLILLVIALFFADSVATLFRLFPVSVLGVILFFGGIELAASMSGDGLSRPNRTVLVVTAGIALWNMGAAYLAGLLLYHASARGIVHL